MSSPDRRRNGAVPGSSPASGSEIITILPRSCPRHLSKSRVRFIGATMTGAVTVPLVPGVQAIGIAVSCNGRGATMRTLARSMDQPRPNAKPSL